MSDLMTPQFNEGGPSGLGYSEIESYLRCPKEYQYEKIRGISRPTSSSPDYFAVGSFVHAGRARWFANKQRTDDETWQQIRADVQKTRESLPLPCSDDAERDALRYLQEYVDHWSVRPKPNIAAVEHLLGPVSLGDVSEPHLQRTARLDDFGFYPEAGGMAIGECKTTAAPISDCVNQYTLHGQPVLQKILWDLAPQGKDTYGEVRGTVLDVIQKGYGGRRCQFARIFIEIQPRVQSWWHAELTKALQQKAAMKYHSVVERRITSCTRLAGKARVACQFRDLCQHGESAAVQYVMDGRGLHEWQGSDTDPNPWD